VSVSDDLELNGIEMSGGRVAIIKIQLPAAYRKLGTALLPQLAFLTESGASFGKTGKNVCFWQRLK
jgi:hypothetical protein